MHSVWVACILCISVSTVCSSENTTESALLGNDTTEQTLPSYLVGKHKSLLTCVSYEYESSEYEIMGNGFALIKASNLIVNRSFYFIKDEMLRMCSESGDESMEKKQFTVASYLTLVGLAISMISLFLHLVVFCLVPSLRNQPGCNLATLCGTLLISYALFLVISDDDMSKNRDACVAVACATYFFFMVSFLWMSVVSFEVFHALLQATEHLRTCNTEFVPRKFGIYCLGTFGIALLFTIFAVLADLPGFLPDHYRPSFHEICWFNRQNPLVLFFVGPVLILSSLNFFFFILTVYLVRFNRMRKIPEAKKISVSRSYVTYFKLSVIMSVTWISGVVSSSVDAEWLWYIFIILNTLQGFFIFLAFTCSKKVKEHFRQKFNRDT